MELEDERTSEVTYFPPCPHCGAGHYEMIACADAAVREDADMEATMLLVTIWHDPSFPALAEVEEMLMVATERWGPWTGEWKVEELVPMTPKQRENMPPPEFYHLRREEKEEGDD